MFHFLVSLFSLIVLIVIHELGHFLLAKKFNVKVEEFGIGYPPRLIGKKIGETIYSINLLPFGAFVRIPGEIERTEDPRSFSQQSIGKRMLIAFGGVLSFWIVASILLSIVFFQGAPVAITEETDITGVSSVQVLIAQVNKESPAFEAGMKPGDVVKRLRFQESTFEIKEISQLQELTKEYAGKEVSLMVQRGEETKEITLIPRSSPPEGQGPMGIALIKAGIKQYPWYQAPIKGVEATGKMTVAIVYGYANALGNLAQGEPSGIQLMGPVGIFGMLADTQQLGFTYFLNFISMISIHLAIFNLLPIPAVDGGKMMFLLIEGIRGEPIPEEVEQKVTAFSFMILLTLMAWVTIKDIINLF